MANKKVYLKTVYEDPFVGGQTETQYINNGESDFAIVYDEHDHKYNNANIAGKVIFVKNAKNAIARIRTMGNDPSKTY